MEIQSTFIVVDAGNSFVKIGIYINNELTEIQRFEFEKIQSIDAVYRNCKGIISSVLSESQTLALQHFFPHTLIFDENLKLPIQLNYKTPLTLGKDRICNAVYAWVTNPSKNSVCIDIGTCIKFDVITKTGVYEGGSISPGINLRYRSMNEFTANLPLLDETSPISLIGKSTHESMHSGVINGMQAEIIQMIERYTSLYSDLTFFMTGGDAKYFDFDSKNNIFAIENLTLEGLYHIFLFNDQ